MKKHLSKIVTLALVLGISTFLVNAAPTGSFRTVAVLEINFDFQIGNKTFSKGKYTLSQRDQNALMLQNNSNAKTKILFGSNSAGAKGKGQRIELTFNRYGDRYFLQSIKTPVVLSKVKASKQERLAKRKTQNQMAKVVLTNGK